jgi:hypothetical protein
MDRVRIHRAAGIGAFSAIWWIPYYPVRSIVDIVIGGPSLW